MKFSEAEKEIIIKKLISLGCAYYDRPAATVADPEKTLLEGLRYFWDGKSLFDMLVGVLEHRLYNLINIERLVALAKEIKDDRRLVLLALAHRLAHNDKRFLYVIREIPKISRFKEFPIPEAYSSTRLMSKWGVDPDFKKMGIQVPNFFGEKSAKFYEIGTLLKMNPWLRVRSLIGPNYRADIIYLKSLGEVTRPQDAARILGCQRATAYNIWSTISTTPFIESSDFFTRQELPCIFK